MCVDDDDDDGRYPRPRGVLFVRLKSMDGSRGRLCGYRVMKWRLRARKQVTFFGGERQKGFFSNA